SPRSFSRRSRSSPKAAGSDGLTKSFRVRFLRPPSERAAEEEIEGFLPALLESRGQVHRAEQRIETQKDAGVLARGAEAHVAAISPDVARFERKAEIRRQVQHARTGPADLLVIQEARNAEVPAAQRSRLQAREIQEPAEREERAHIAHLAVERRTKGGP